MSEKVKTLKIQREKGWLYFVDNEGDVSRTKVPVRVPKPKPEASSTALPAPEDGAQGSATNVDKG